MEDSRSRVGDAEQSSGLGHPDHAVAREAARALVSKGAAVLPTMRELAMSASSPDVRKRAKDVIGQVSGN